MRNQLTSIRPVISTINIEQEAGEIERFQNETLRPILKFQNNLILSIFRNQLEKYKSIFDQLTGNKRNKYIEQTIQKDRKLHQLLMGTIIGHFTDVEWEIYIPHEKEFNRRITKLLIQRLQHEL